MPATDVCPSAADLERLARGTLPRTDADRLARHLERCNRCTAQVGRLRGQHGNTPPVTDELARADAGTLPPPLPTGKATPFLAPPRGPGELGWLTHYRVLKPLGQGGMGQVFLAEDTLLARPVALKVMLPALAASGTNRDRFLREARAAAALTHDHIVTIYQVGEANGAPYLAMQLLQGESLDDYIKRGKTLSPGHISRVGRETATGLAAAHAKGLVHRDIKPANLWLETPRGRVKILDFGLARGTEDPQLTGSGMVLGTPSYMAPEQARGLAIDGRCDLWSLGVVLFRLCSGRLPFEGKEVLAVLSSIALDEAPPLREVAPETPPEMADLVSQLLSKDVSKRPKTAREVADRLLQIERGLSKTAKIVVEPAGDEPSRTESLPPQSSPRFRPKNAPSAGRKRVVRGVAAGFLAVVLLGGGYFLWSRNRSSQVDDATAKLPPPPVVIPDDPKVTAPPPEPRRAGGAPKGAALTTLTSSRREAGLASAPLILEYINGGQTLVVADRESVSLRDTATGAYRPSQPIGEAMRQAYRGTIMVAALAADGRTLALAVHAPDTARGAPHRLVLWDIVAQQERGTLPTSIRYDALAFAADRPLLASSTDGEIRLWDLSKPLPKSQVGTLTEAKVTDLAFSPTEPVLAIGRSNGQLRLWDVAQDKERWHGTGPPNIAVQGLTFSPDGRWLVASTVNERFLRVWDVKTGQIHANTNGMGKRLAFSPDGRFLAHGSVGVNGTDNRRLEVFDVEARRLVARSTLNAHTDFIAALAFTPDGKTVVTGSSDKSLKFWDVTALK